MLIMSSQKTMPFAVSIIALLPPSLGSKGLLTLPPLVSQVGDQPKQLSCEAQGCRRAMYCLSALGAAARQHVQHANCACWHVSQLAVTVTHIVKSMLLAAAGWLAHMASESVHPVEPSCYVELMYAWCRSPSYSVTSGLRVTLLTRCLPLFMPLVISLSVSVMLPP